MSFTIHALHSLKKFILFVQKKSCQIHKLHDHIIDAVKDFLGDFVKPEHLMCEKKFKNALDNVKINKSNELMVFNDKGEEIKPSSQESPLRKLRDMNVGTKVSEMLKLLDDREQIKFLKKVRLAMTVTGKYLILKLPINNEVLIHVSALDPLLRTNSNAQEYMKKLPTFIKGAIEKNEEDEYQKQVQRYHHQYSLTVPPADEDTVFDEWWGELIRKGEFPVLGKLVKTVLSCFHGPVVESSFSIMGNIIHSKTANLDIETFDAIQTVKYSLKASGKSAVEYFIKKDHLHDKVNPKLVKNMNSSHKQYEQKRKEIEEKGKAKKEQLELDMSKPISKSKGKMLKMPEIEKD